MTPEHESSYYEIALTNRQVLTIFVVLLTCLVAAFLSGVWIGRRDGAEGVLQAATSEPPVEQAAAQLTELNFFSDAPPLKDPASSGRREPAGKAAVSAPPETSPPVGGDGASTTEGAARPERQPAAPPAPAPAASEPPAPKPAATPPAAAAEGRVIQVFSSTDSTQARRLVQRLGAGGYPVFLLQEQLEGQTTYRVRVGPYSGEGEARKIADELRREYRLETWITSQQG